MSLNRWTQVCDNRESLIKSDFPKNLDIYQLPSGKADETNDKILLSYKTNYINYKDQQSSQFLNVVLHSRGIQLEYQQISPTEFMNSKYLVGFLTKHNLTIETSYRSQHIEIPNPNNNTIQRFCKSTQTYSPLNRDELNKLLIFIVKDNFSNLNYDLASLVSDFIDAQACYRKMNMPANMNLDKNSNLFKPINTSNNNSDCKSEPTTPIEKQSRPRAENWGYFGP